MSEQKNEGQMLEVRRWETHRPGPRDARPQGEKTWPGGRPVLGESDHVGAGGQGPPGGHGQEDAMGEAARELWHEAPAAGQGRRPGAPGIRGHMWKTEVSKGTVWPEKFRVAKVWPESSRLRRHGLGSGPRDHGKDLACHPCPRALAVSAGWGGSKGHGIGVFFRRIIPYIAGWMERRAVGVSGLQIIGCVWKGWQNCWWLWDVRKRETTRITPKCLF